MLLPLGSAALGLYDGTFDAGALYDSVVLVTVDGVPRCSTTVVVPSTGNTTSLALSTASCFLRSTTLSPAQQLGCLRGACGADTLVPTASIRLVGGPDTREAPVVARVKRLAVRFAAWWAMGDVCSPAQCGEGWDVALLELEQSCESGPIPCIPAVGLPSAPPIVGLATQAVAFGQFPSYHRREEWHLNLGEDGSGIRRHVATRVEAVLSQQLLQLADESTWDTSADDDGEFPYDEDEAFSWVHDALDSDSGGGSHDGSDDGLDKKGRGKQGEDDEGIISGGSSGSGSPICVGDLGAALLTVRDGRWELAGVGLYSAATWQAVGTASAAQLGTSGCDRAGKAWSVHAARCWLEAQGRAWGRAEALSAAAAAECGPDLDFFAPELAAKAAASGGVHAAEYHDVDGCASLDCGAHGACIDGRCVCFPADGMVGPLCTVPEATRATAGATSGTPRTTIAVSPSLGYDSDGCGTTRRPCATLRHALLRQYWDWAARPESSQHLAAAVVALRGRFSGAGNNTALQLHGVPVTIRALHGPDATVLDCTRATGDAAWGVLFAKGETADVRLEGFSLRKCLTESQSHWALADHPRHAHAIAGAARWPQTRGGATFVGNLWLGS